MASARDRHLLQLLVDQLFTGSTGLDMDEDAAGRLALSAVAGHRVSVIESRGSCGSSDVVRPESHRMSMPPWPSMRSIVPSAIRCGHLDAVTRGKYSFRFPSKNYGLHGSGTELIASTSVATGLTQGPLMMTPHSIETSRDQRFIFAEVKHVRRRDVA
jgi:hypothetical protein